MFSSDGDSAKKNPMSKLKNTLDTFSIIPLT